MNIEEIFGKIAETRLLERLAAHKHLCFAGDADLVDYLRGQASLGGGGGRRFLVLEAGQTTLEPPPKAQALIALSRRDESAVQRRLRQVSALPVFRLFDDILVNLLTERDLLQTAPEAPPFPARCYAILTTPRSGSTLLSQLLASTGVGGRPREHLRLPTQTLSRECGFDYVRLLRILAAQRATSNGVFGTKLIAHFLEKHRVKGLPFDEVAKAFRFVSLVRVDRVSQAVSLHVAQSTGIWHVHDDRTRKVYAERLQAIQVDRAHIDGVRAMYNEIRREEGWMAQFLDRWSIRPLLVEYEALYADPDVQVKRVLEFLGIDDPYALQPRKTTSKQLRSDINQRLGAAYREAYGEG
jgi:LPS sulfotransferase NodH